MMSTRQKKQPVKQIIDSTATPPPPLCGWSDLNKDVLRIIFRKLKDHDSHDNNNNTIYRCGNVCVSWQSVARSILPQYLLLLSNEGIFEDQNFNLKNKNSCFLFNLFTKRVGKISLPEELKGRRFNASSFGWLLTISIESPHEIALINPFSPDQKIELPDTTKIINMFNAERREFSNFNRELRVISSTNPLDPNCVFVAVDGDSFESTPAFCKLGDESWTIMSKLLWRVCTDVRFHKGKFYAVDLNGNLLSVHLNSLSSDDCIDCLVPESPKYRNINYLVELNDDLLLVGRRRVLTTLYEITVGFDVYKWIQDEKRWSDRVEDIGNNVILLGKYSSIAIPVGHPLKVICDGGDLKANSIYFIDDVRCWRSKHHNDAGLYNMASRKIDWRPKCWPIWISPVNWLRPML
ncbi:hypothetical protein Ddye_027616 [Dipteronia dyeriana]|uniref:KIB1-4 beta-propeller domain-containing protein n=1 Tax=Dipteronia dyeriana TaxID=168575 RepID=A0AAD9TPN2_9ROSI|nr:hypothetical protein Ddye_027616 [Dipteronia dyeriana]